MYLPPPLPRFLKVEAAIKAVSVSLTGGDGSGGKTRLLTVEELGKKSAAGKCPSILAGGLRV